MIEIKLYNESRRGKNYIVKNSSDVTFNLENKNGLNLTFPANGETMITIPADNMNKFTVSNLFIKGTENLQISLKL